MSIQGRPRRAGVGSGARPGSPEPRDPGAPPEAIAGTTMPDGWHRPGSDPEVRWPTDRLRNGMLRSGFAQVARRELIMEKRTYFNLWYLVAALIGVLWLRDVWVNARQVEPIPYSQFQQDLKEGRIKDIAIST